MTTMTTPAPNRLPLLVVGALTLLVIGVASFRSSGVSIREPDAVAIEVRELRFEDRKDGSVAVIDHNTNRQIDAITGEAGFARGTLRGFARDRRARSVGPEHPIQLIARADGRLTMADPMTGRIVDLESFGPGNAAVFGRFLAAGGRQ